MKRTPEHLLQTLIDSSPELARYKLRQLIDGETNLSLLNKQKNRREHAQKHTEAFELLMASKLYSLHKYAQQLAEEAECKEIKK